MKAAVQRIGAGLLLAAASTAAVAQSTAPADDRTFFGYQMGERVKGPASDFAQVTVGSSKLFQRKFYLPQQESPSWATGRMQISQMAAPPGILVESIFTVDVFQGFTDKHDQRDHAAKVKELVNMMTAKLGQQPTRVVPWPKRIFNPADLRTPPLAIQATEWDLPWGQVTVIGCAFDSFPYYECESNDARPSVIVRTSQMVEAIRALNESKRQQQQQIEQNRRKL